MPNSISYIFKQGSALSTPSVKQLLAPRTYGMQGLLVKLGVSFGGGKPRVLPPVDAAAQQKLPGYQPDGAARDREGNTPGYWSDKSLRQRQSKRYMLHTPPLEFPYKDRPNTRGNTPAMAAGAADARSAPAPATAEGFTPRRPSGSVRGEGYGIATMVPVHEKPAPRMYPDDAGRGFPEDYFKTNSLGKQPFGWDMDPNIRNRMRSQFINYNQAYQDVYGKAPPLIPTEMERRFAQEEMAHDKDAGPTPSEVESSMNSLRQMKHFFSPEAEDAMKTRTIGDLHTINDLQDKGEENWTPADRAWYESHTAKPPPWERQPEQGVNGATIAAAPAPASPATPQSPGEVGAPPTQPMDAATLSDPQALITRANSPENVAKVVDVYNASAAQGAFNGASVSPDTLTKGVNLQQQIANLSVEDVQVFMQAINDSQTAMAKEIRAGLEASGVNVPELIGQYASQIEAGEMPDETGQAILDQGAAAAGKTSEEGANDSNFLEGLFAMWEGLESSQKMGLMIGIPLVAIGLFSGVMGGGPMLSAGLGLAGLAAGAAGMAGLFGGEEEAPQQPGGPGSAAGASGDGGALTPPPAPGQPVPPPAPGQPVPPPAPGQPAPNQPAAPAAGGGVIGDTNNDGKVDLAEGQAVLRDPAMKQQLFNLPPAQQKEYLRSLPQEAKTKFESMVMPYNINSFGSRQKVYDAAQKEGLTPAEVDAIIKIIGPSGKIG